MDKKQRAVVTLCFKDEELDNIIDKLNDPNNNTALADRKELVELFIKAKEELRITIESDHRVNAVDIKITKYDAFRLLNYFMIGKI